MLNAYVSGFYYFLINKFSHACYKVLLIGYVGAIVTVRDVLLCSIRQISCVTLWRTI